MSKRPEQHNSLKKINAQSVRHRHLGVLDSLERIIKSQEKIRSQRKYRSSERAPVEEHIKVKKLIPARLRTQVEDYVAHLTHRISQSKTPYHKLAQFRKKKTIAEEPTDSRAPKQYSFGGKNRFRDFETATAINQQRGSHHRKALFLNETYMGRNFKKPEFEQPLTSKATSRKPNERSDRSIKRKLDLEKYTSESLQKLNINHRTNEECGTDVKKKSQKTIEKKSRKRDHTICDEITDNLKDSAERYADSDDDDYAFKLESSVLQFVIQEFEDKGRRIKTEMGESREKLDIVFQKRKPEKKLSNPFDLSRQELETFGDRFPQTFQKVKLLGRGGFSLVWLGEHRKSKKQFAIKQIRTENNHQTHIKEIWFGTYFFEMGGLPKKEFSKHPGIKNLVKIYSYDINKSDTWIFYEKCGESLGNALYDLKGDTYVGQRLYRVTQP